MRYVVKKPFTTKKAHYQVGDTIQSSNADTIRPFIESGFVVDWCLSVCMLTEQMSKLCERAKPCLRYEVSNG